MRNITQPIFWVIIYSVQNLYKKFFFVKSGKEDSTELDYSTSSETSTFSSSLSTLISKSKNVSLVPFRFTTKVPKHL